MNKVDILSRLNATNSDTLMETLSITYTDLGDNFLIAKMPVNTSVYQPLGFLHGGATAALVETVGSAASMYFIDRDKYIVKGLELSINHVKSVKKGFIYAKAQFIHKGGTTHLLEVSVTNDEGVLVSLAKLTNIILAKK